MEEIEQLQKDFLTGFYTREYLVSALLKRIIDANLHNEKFSVLLVDIDHFKKINDKYGHLWGDEFLKYVASTLRLSLEDKGSIFRYGGDEFVVLFNDPVPKRTFLLAKQFNTVMRNRPFLFHAHLFKITISCGLATYPDNAQGAEDLLKVADKALYFSKRYGRNTTTPAGKIGWLKFKFILIVLLEIFFIVGLVFSLNNYFSPNLLAKTLKKLPIKKFFPVGMEADTTIVLESGDVILGRIVSEDEKKLVFSVSLGRGSCTMDIEKASIKSIVRKNTDSETEQK